LNYARGWWPHASTAKILRRVEQPSWPNENQFLKAIKKVLNAYIEKSSTWHSPCQAFEFLI
jgi:hypothetical protein